MRKTVEIVADLCREHGLTEWRQSAYNLRQLKKLYRKAQKLKHSTSKEDAKREAQKVAMREAHRRYLEQSQRLLERAQTTRQHLVKRVLCEGMLEQLDEFMRHAVRQIDQVRRRVLEGQSIAREEKVFSLFQPHTEWISKGKAGVPVELGLRTCVVEDQHRFM